VNLFEIMRSFIINKGNERLGKVAEYVKTQLEEAAVKFPDPWHDPVYRWQQLLGTKKGQALFNQQLDLQIIFFQEIIKESELTVFPKVE